MKKILLIIALLISGLGLNAQSATIGGLKFNVTSIEPAECEVLGYSGKPVDVTIPSKVTISGKEYSVTSIRGFYHCSSLKSIEIPSGVTSIESSAFTDCSSLTSIDFGENSQLTYIGYDVFYGCESLTSIEIPSGVTEINPDAFYGCSSLTSIDFGENSQLTFIDHEAFYGCESLTSIEIPSGVTEIEYDAFYGCSSLTSIDFGDNSQLTSIGNRAFYGCSSLTSIDFGDNSQLTSIGNRAFYGCSSLTSIEIPSGVTSIGDYAFYECSSLTSLEIPSGVTSIGVAAFYECSSLTSIDFGENSQLISIGEAAFNWCESLTSIEIPSGVTEIEYEVFSYCSSLTSIDFGENSQLTSIGWEAFSGCSSLTSIEIPSGVTSIGYDAFSGCSSLTSIVVESGNMVYDSRNDCNAIIETATNTLIAGCQNTVIPSSVTSIGEYAFRYCSSLTSIEIPSSVTSIGERAFSGCSSLTSIVVESGNIVYDSRDNCNAIIETATNTLIAGCQNTVIPNTVSFIGDYAFSYCSSLTSIEIPSGVTSIGEWAFWDCSSLTSIELPSSVTSIGESAFEMCYSLTSIYCYAESVPETDSDAFDYCPSDMVIYVPEQSIYAYKIASPWKKYTIMVMPYFVIVASNPEDAGIITGAGAYAINDTVTLTATANEGYKFINWTENDSVISEVAEYTFVVENDREFVANFELLTYEVTASVNDENFGAVTGADTYSHGEEVTLTATANEGYKFVNWTEKDTVVSTEAEYTFVITGDRSLVANFVTLHEVTASVNDENFGSVAGAGIYGYGEEVTLTATANEGYKFVNWTENDSVVSTEAEYSFVITGDRNLVANFELLTYEVVASVNIENAGEITGAGIYGYGEEVTLTATANEGYKFVNWTEKDTVVSTEAEYSFVITGNRSLVANFVSTESISELEASFKVYPNPASDMLFIEAEIEVEEVAIFDVYGRQQNLSNSATQQLSNSIDVSSLNNGVYFVKVVTSEGEVVMRFIKE